MCTFSMSESGCRGSQNNPFTPSLTKSSGPPLAGATTGTPDANASCMDWQNVSLNPA